MSLQAFPDTLSLRPQVVQECLRAQNGIGETIYHNVCEGTVYTVPWGGMYWMLFVLGVVAVLLVAGLIAAMIHDGYG